MRPEAETVPALLALRHEVDGDLRAVVTEDAAITYAQLDDASRAVAARLIADGVVKGDRVALLAPNGIEWVTLAYAVVRIGAVLVPLSTLLRPPELLAQLTAAAVSHLLLARGFRDRRYLDDLEAAAPGLVDAVRAGGRHTAAPALRRVWTVDALPGSSVPMELVVAMEARVRPADDLVVLFTSGSTGRPKGTIHTHGGALRATAAGLDARCVGPGERLYLPMPFFWTGGFSGGVLSTLIAGATLLTEAEPTPERTLALLERERATLFRGWPDQAVALAAHPSFAAADLSSLGDGSLGAVLPAERRPAPGARPNLFGMTESFGPYCGDALDRDLADDKRGSCGRPFDGVEVRIAADGEIWLRGPNLMRGVCGRPRSDVFTSDGWYRTGDRGRLDEGGYLWYEGRLDDMFKVKGATVYPSEVEAALRSVADVRQAHVTEVDGEVGALVVTTGSLDIVAAAAKERLSAFKLPTRWLLVPEVGAVPMTVTGKVDKAAVRTSIVEGGRKI